LKVKQENIQNLNENLEKKVVGYVKVEKKLYKTKLMEAIIASLWLERAQAIKQLEFKNTRPEGTRTTGYHS
jgi:hypothetical protein